MNDHINNENDVNEIENELDKIEREIKTLTDENYHLSMTLKNNIDMNVLNENLNTSEFVSKLIELDNKTREDSLETFDIKDIKNKKLLNSYSSVFSSLNNIFNISNSNYVTIRSKIHSYKKKSKRFVKNESTIEMIKNNSTVKIYIIRESDYLNKLSNNKENLTLDEIATYLTEKQDSYFSSSILKYDHLYNVEDQYSLFKIKKLACNYYRINDEDYLMINLCGELINLDGIFYDELKKINVESKLMDPTDKFYMMSEDIISSEKFKFALISKQLYCDIIGIRYNLILMYKPCIKCKIFLNSNYL